MFLTRLGANSKMVVTGDDTQIDLPRGVRSGSLDVERLFTGSGRRRDRAAWGPPTSCGTRSSAGSSRPTSGCQPRTRRVIYLSNHTRNAGLDTRSLSATLERLLAEIGEARHQCVPRLRARPGDAGDQSPPSRQGRGDRRAEFPALSRPKRSTAAARRGRAGTGPARNACWATSSSALTPPNARQPSTTCRRTARSNGCSSTPCCIWRATIMKRPGERTPDGARRAPPGAFHRNAVALPRKNGTMTSPLALAAALLLAAAPGAPAAPAPPAAGATRTGRSSTDDPQVQALVRPRLDDALRLRRRRSAGRVRRGRAARPGLRDGVLGAGRGRRDRHQRADRRRKATKRGEDAVAKAARHLAHATPSRTRI